MLGLDVTQRPETFAALISLCRRCALAHMPCIRDWRSYHLSTALFSLFVGALDDFHTPLREHFALLAHADSPRHVRFRYGS